MTEREIIESCLNEVQEILHKVRPKKRWLLYYGKPDEQTEFVITDWNRTYMNLRDDSDYVFFYSLDEFALLYAIDVSGESVLFTLSEVFDLLWKKF